MHENKEKVILKETIRASFLFYDNGALLLRNVGMIKQINFNYFFSEIKERRGF